MGGEKTKEGPEAGLLHPNGAHAFAWHRANADSDSAGLGGGGRLRV